MGLSTENTRVIIGLFWYEISQSLHVEQRNVNRYASISEIFCLFVCLFLAQKPPPPKWARASSFTRFLDHTQRRTTGGRTPLDERSARRIDLYLTTHNRQISMPPVGFEPIISAGEWPQTHALDRAATGTGSISEVSNTIIY